MPDTPELANAPAVGVDPNGLTNVGDNPLSVPPQPNVEEALDKVRRQESEKYSRKLRYSENKIKELEDKLNEATDRLAKFKSVEEGDVSIIRKPDDKAPRQLDNSSDVFIKEIDTIKSRLSATERENQELRRTIMVDALVKQFNGEIIPDLIQGNTPDEIIASAEVAAARYAEIKNSVLKSLAPPPPKEPNLTTDTTPAGTIPSPVQPNTGRSSDTPVQNVMASLHAMTPTERIRYLGSQTPEMREAIKRAAVDEQVEIFRKL